MGLGVSLLSALFQSVVSGVPALIAQRDKQKHVACSFGLYLLLVSFASLWCALVTTLLIGLAKEVWDKYYGSGFCYYDLLSNCIGIGLAMPIGWLLISPPSL